MSTARKPIGSKARKQESERRKEAAHLLRRFGTYLTYRREQQQLNLRQFAVRVRMAHSHVFQLERLQGDPRLSELQRLAHAFNESLGIFLKPLLEADDTDSREQNTGAPEQLQQ